MKKKLKRIYDYFFTDYIFTSEGNIVILLSFFMTIVGRIGQKLDNYYGIIMILTVIPFVFIMKLLIKKGMIKHILSIFFLISWLRDLVNSIGNFLFS